MNLMKALAITLALALAALLGLAYARPAHAQGPDRQRWMRDFMVLEGPGSQIGVTARDLEAAEAERFNVTGGILLETVTPDGPAAKAGLRSQDVVVEFDGERVRSLRQFTRLVRETPPGRAVAATVLRDGKRTEVTVSPAAGGSGDFAIDTGRLRDRLEDFTARIPQFEVGVRDLTPRARLGVNAQELTPELAQYFGAKNGVLVASVVTDSPASRAGLRAGDVITAVAGRPVSSSADLVRELRAVGNDGGVTLAIVRDKKASTVTAKIEVPGDRRARPERPLRQVRPIRTPV
jgi:serine protease Do